MDTQGLPHAIHVTTANVTDRAGAIEMVTKWQDNLTGITNVMVDAGYTGEPFASSVQDIIGATVEVVAPYLCRDTHTLGCRALILVVGEMPPTLEEL